jgi:hypothetical protein
MMNIFILTILLILYVFIPFGWKFIPYINYGFNFEDSVKQGRIIYNDVRLIEYFRRNFLVLPSGVRIDNTQTKTIYYPQLRQVKFVDELLKKKRHGFFIETSTDGGKQLSNTLFFEKERNWTGLLIEANPLRSKISHIIIAMLIYRTHVLVKVCMQWKSI